MKTSKSENSVEASLLTWHWIGRPAKKGKPSAPSGPTAAAAAKFATPMTPIASRSSSTPISNSASALGAPTPSQLPQGVYVNDLGGFELDGAEPTFTEEDGLTVQAVTGSKVRLQSNYIQSFPSESDTPLTFYHQSIVQIEVVDVAASAAATVVTGISPDEATVQLAFSTATPKAGSKGGRSMRQLELILGAFQGNFTHILIPKLINFISNTASGPWKLTGVNLVDAVKDLAAESFPEGLVFNIAPRQLFYEVVSVRYGPDLPEL